jgi:hypothetical protein
MIVSAIGLFLLAAMAYDGVVPESQVVLAES